MLETTLKVDALLFNDGNFSMWTRAYEGSLPGPTLRLRPGEDLVIHLVNNLGPNNRARLGAAALASPPLITSPHGPNNTNLHTHGLQVSPEGVADNVRRSVPPGTSATFVYNLSSDHPAGIYWYHPHHDGSGNVQLGGGMAGLLLVDDLPGTVPAELAAIPEVPLLLQVRPPQGPCALPA